MDKILRMSAVITATGLSRSAIYSKLAQEGEAFPKPIRLGERAIGFVESEIAEWIAARIAASRGDQVAK